MFIIVELSSFPVDDQYRYTEATTVLTPFLLEWRVLRLFRVWFPFRVNLDDPFN